MKQNNGKYYLYAFLAIAIGLILGVYGSGGINKSNNDQIRATGINSQRIPEDLLK